MLCFFFPILSKLLETQDLFVKCNTTARYYCLYTENLHREYILFAYREFENKLEQHVLAKSSRKKKLYVQKFQTCITGDRVSHVVPGGSDVSGPHSGVLALARVGRARNDERTFLLHFSQGSVTCNLFDHVISELNNFIRRHKY